MSSNRTGKTIGDVLDEGLCEGHVLTSAAAGVRRLLFIGQLKEDTPRAWKSSLGGGQTSMCKTCECC